MDCCKLHKKQFALMARVCAGTSWGWLIGGVMKGVCSTQTAMLVASKDEVLDGGEGVKMIAT
jgi:hypothetical protein